MKSYKAHKGKGGKVLKMDKALSISGRISMLVEGMKIKVAKKAAYPVSGPVTTVAPGFRLMETSKAVAVFNAASPKMEASRRYLAEN